MTIYRAYVTASGQLKSYVLTHDVKKNLQIFEGKTGHILITSLQATTAVLLAENDPEILTPYLQYTFSQFQNSPKVTKPRRSGLSGPAYHLMAALTGLTLAVPFENGKLLTSPHQEVMALDYEPKPGRREFLLSYFPQTAPEGKA